MTLVATLSLVDESEDSARYEGPAEGGQPAAVGTLMVQKWALPKPTPASVRVLLDFYTPAKPGLPEPATGESESARRARDVLAKGDRVTIVKNTTAGTKYPPEWLQQYLGRTGRVLWTTDHGAMVKLDDEATWFHYAELKAGG